MAPVSFGSVEFKDEDVDEINIDSDVVQFVDDYTFRIGQNEVRLFRDYVAGTGLLSAIERCHAGGAGTGRAAVTGTLKYSFAYDRVLYVFVGTDSVNALGLPYAIEAATDLECALALAAERRFKPSNHMLRSALEGVVAHAHFSTSGVMYDDLARLRVPPMTDRRRGMLNRLATIGLVHTADASFFSDLYARLSDATHSQYRYLTTKFEEVDETDLFRRTLQHIREVSLSCITILVNMDRMQIHATVDASTAASQHT